MKFIDLYFSSKGRLGRLSYFWATLKVGAVSGFVHVIIKFPILLFDLGLMSCLCYISFCIISKRLHDFGLKTYWSILYLIFQVSLLFQPPQFIFIQFIFILFPLNLYFLFKKGDKGQNEYGKPQVKKKTNLNDEKIEILNCSNNKDIKDNKVYVGITIGRIMKLFLKIMLGITITVGSYMLLTKKTTVSQEQPTQALAKVGWDEFYEGVKYRKGDGVVKNEETAIYYFLKSAEKGNSCACVNISIILSYRTLNYNEYASQNEQLKESKSYILPLKWSLIARAFFKFGGICDSGLKGIDDRILKIENHMFKNDELKAQKLATEWVEELGRKNQIKNSQITPLLTEEQLNLNLK